MLVEIVIQGVNYLLKTSFSIANDEIQTRLILWHDFGHGFTRPSPSNRSILGARVAFSLPPLPHDGGGGTRGSPPPWWGEWRSRLTGPCWPGGRRHGWRFRPCWCGVRGLNVIVHHRQSGLCGCRCSARTTASTLNQKINHKCKRFPIFKRSSPPKDNLSNQ